MANKVWPVAVLLLTLHFCQAKSALDEARQMAASYASCTARYDRLQEEYELKIRSGRPGQNQNESIAAYNRTLAKKKAELGELLRQNGKSRSSNELDLLRSKIMIEAGRTDDAEKIIDRLCAIQSPLALEAKLQKVSIYLLKQRPTKALELFKSIESLLKKDAQFFKICLALARSNLDGRIREEYAHKFVDSPELPVSLRPYKTLVYADLATWAKDARRLNQANSYFEKAQAMSHYQPWRKKLTAELEQISLMDKPAPPLQGESWLNSRALPWLSLRGRVVIITFWAPWCPSCRELLPVLQEQYSQLKNQGLLVIGCTKLYGCSSDDVGKVEKVNAAEELALIQKYLENNRILYPVLVGAEGRSFDTYAVTAVPTLVFLDRRGVVETIQSGSSTPQRIRAQIKSLLAETK
ncbi:MAG: TlpA family protein disulfide reductase [Candidatus Aminicenantes bacterium]|nr:TlpA family protein disulfide reductase [Candidatus Aminicenantes bacterium]